MLKTLPPQDNGMNISLKDYANQNQEIGLDLENEDNLKFFSITILRLIIWKKLLFDEVSSLLDGIHIENSMFVFESTFTEAGGVVTDAGGKPLDFSKGKYLDVDTGIIVTNQKLMPALLKAVKESVEEKTSSL
ncbi:hypothetical protein FEM48_Zijuj08G0194800 [Ziziphus jujuba var. spinosa]|uniref:SAL1 phosphatase-like n=1 Tax=Ziziphus jujuba var. spinosa TaxID=714518 RepID=A0A978V0Y4_ZIZJJ|nr:hypothetical protein FEM48_Zijuj08G0194800 [Ziziphus jujuba var. spinosa]